MGDIAEGFANAFRDFAVLGVPSSGANQPTKAEIRAVGALLDRAVSAAQAGITPVATLAARDAFFAAEANRGKLVYVNNNNGSATDPANGVYEYVDGARLAQAFYAGVATVVLPLVDAAAGSAEDADASASIFRPYLNVFDYTDGLSAVPAGPQIVSAGGLGSSTLAASADGLAITQVSTGGVHGIPTRYQTSDGPISFELDITATNIINNRFVGFALGSGSDVKYYIWAGSGALVSYTAADAQTTLLSASSATRGWAAGQSIKIRVEINENRSGKIILTSPTGVVSTKNIDGTTGLFPTGPIWFALRGGGTYTFTEMRFKGQLSNRLAPAADNSLPGVRMLNMPAAFSWLPVAVGVNADGYAAHDYNPYSRQPIASIGAAGTGVFVDPVNGNDTNPGTLGAPLRSMFRALDGRVGSVWVYLLGDTDFTTSGIGANIAGITSLVVMPFGTSRASLSLHFAGLVWSLVPGTTATYQATCPAAPYGVWDRSLLTADSTWTNYPASTASGELPVGTSKISGTTIYVRTHDGRMPDANVRVMGTGEHFPVSGTHAPKIWTRGINIYGGRTVHFQNTGAEAECYLSEGEAGYGTVSGNAMVRLYGNVTSVLGPNFRVVDAPSDCIAYGGANGLEIDVHALLGGRDKGSTDNCSTGHDRGGRKSSIVRIGTAKGKARYTGSWSRPIHDVQGTQALMWGLEVGASRSGVDYDRVALVVGNAGQDAAPNSSNAYIGNVTIDPASGFAVATNDASKLYVHDFDRSGRPDYGTPAFETWAAF